MKVYKSGKIKFSDEKPLVVGVISNKTLFRNASALSRNDCDILEVRLDKIGTDVKDWQKQCCKLENSGFPVIVTVRSRKEGGDWVGEESQRETLLKQALSIVSCVDIELSSELCPTICKYAKQLGKKVIVSYHNFSKTPLSDFLDSIIKKMLSFPNAIPKIATTIVNNKDIIKLIDLLKVNKKRLICILGMGDAAVKTRVIFPAIGSCLTYGFLDSKCAPGQLHSSEIINLLERILPEYHRKK